MIWLLIGIPVAFLLWMAVGIYKIQRVSDGRAAQGQNRALLIIDMQPCFLQGPSYEPNHVTSVMKVVLGAIAAANEKREPIIALQHLWRTPQGALLSRLTAGGAGLPGQDDSEIVAELTVHVEHVLIKQVQDGFATGELDDLLHRLSISKLLVAGLDGLYCVAATSRAARKRGYTIELLEDGILASDKDKWSRRKAELQSL